MKSTYKIVWSTKATKEFDDIYDYLLEKWTAKECDRLVKSTNFVLNFIKNNPFAYPKIRKSAVRKAIILKYNTLYYKVKKDEIEILSFFSNRQKPKNEI